VVQSLQGLRIDAILQLGMTELRSADFPAFLGSEPKGHRKFEEPNTGKY
jgi:hypothetical protein